MNYDRFTEDRGEGTKRDKPERDERDYDLRPMPTLKLIDVQVLRINAVNTPNIVEGRKKLGI